MKHKIYIFIGLLVLTFSFGSFEQSFAQETTKIIERLDIVGNRIYTDADILKYLKTRQGQKFSQKAVDEDLKVLQSLEFLDERNVELIIEPTSKKNVAVIFQISELPIIKKIEIQGLQYINKDGILNDLREEKFEIDKPYDPKKMQRAIIRIQKYLAERGFYEAKILTFRQDVTATTLKVLILIDETPNDDPK